MSHQPMLNLEEKAYNTISQFNMFEGATKVLCGYSGGADSSALLYLLHSYLTEKGIELYAIHINHGIRGSAADSDMEFCRDTCDKLGIPFVAEKYDVPALACQWGMGEEEAGRKIRYDAFEALCKDKGIDKICTAHHACDNAETVIFNLCRGAGAKGLSGIPPVRDNIVRPLIDCTKDDILEYIEHYGIEYREDATNSEDEYTRNYIRHNVIPALCSINERAIDNIACSTSLLREDDSYLFEVAREHIDDKVSMLALLPSPILSRTLMIKTGDRHINLDVAIAVIREAKPTMISVGAATRMVISDDTLEFVTDTREKSDIAFDYILTQDTTDIPELGSVMIISDRESEGQCVGFDSENICGPLRVTSRPSGAKMSVRGVNRTIKNILQENTVPSHKRDKLVYVSDDKGLLWIPGVAFSDRIKKSKANKYLIYKEAKNEIK